jgi:hypothetical protein
LQQYNIQRANANLPSVDLKTFLSIGSPTTQVAQTQFPEDVPLPPVRPAGLGEEAPAAPAPAVAQQPNPQDQKLVATTSAPASNASSQTGNTQDGIKAAIQANGLDVSKLSTSDLQRLNSVSQGVANGTISVAQAGQIVSQMAQGQTLTGSISSWLSQPGNEVKMALGLAGAAFGALMYNNQVNQAKQVQAQIQAASAQASAQLQQLAQPILSQVNYGPTASDIQNIQAAQAQAAQAFAQSGSVGAAQQQRAIQDYVTRLADNRMQQNLQLFGAASPYLTSAINTNLQGVMSGLQTSLGIQQAAQSAVGSFAAGLARMFV